MYMNNQKGEISTARRLVKAALAAGYKVKCWDGGDEPALDWSIEFASIWDAIGNTETDELLLRDAKGNQSWIYLVWGNDNSGCELIADHSANDAMEALWEAAVRN